MVQCVVHKRSDRISPTDYRAQLHQKHREGVVLGTHQHGEPADVVVEVERRHVVHLEAVVVVGVLVDQSVGPVGHSVPSRHDVQMIVTDIGVWSAVHLVVDDILVEVG